MSASEWEQAYRMAWDTYYTREHTEAVLRRLVAMRASASNAILLMTWFKGSIHIEKVHPLEAGFFRYKFRRDRRAGLPIEPRWRFYASYLAESIAKLKRWTSIYFELRRIYVRIKKDPKRYEYMDTALTPVTDDELDTLDLFHHTAAAEAFVAFEHKPAHAPRETLTSV
jgi:hypothetical protein